MTIDELTEDQLIDSIKKNAPLSLNTLHGIGDDCAVLKTASCDKVTLFKTDSVIENVHFTSDTEPRLIGHKAVARVFSDIAAMGGKPSEILVTLILPKQIESTWVNELYEGINELCRTWNVGLVGGETSQSPHGSVTITISGLGEAIKDQVVLRSTAKAGDSIWVTGKIGNSFESKRHLTFTPRILESQWLVNQSGALPLPTSMIDISDGLLLDLQRVCKLSGVGYALNKTSIPLHDDRDLEQALRDGEDYELLFTLPAGIDTDELKKQWRHTFESLELTRIGEITDTPLPLKNTDGWSSLTSSAFTPK